MFSVQFGCLDTSGQILSQDKTKEDGKDGEPPQYHDIYQSHQPQQTNPYPQQPPQMNPVAQQQENVYPNQQSTYDFPFTVVTQPQLVSITKIQFPYIMNNQNS